MIAVRLVLLFLLCPLLVVTACFASSRPCYTPEQVSQHAGKEICLSAHVYDVVEDNDGIRYLDVCKPGVPDESCRLTIVSLATDRKEVGALDHIREQDVQLRGVVHGMHGQSVMLLSHARQFHDGPEKFRPNPELLGNFSAEHAGLGFKDSALRERKTKQATVFKGAIGSKY